MGFIHENINKSTFSSPANVKHVTFGKVQTLEYVKEEPKVSMKKKIVGFLDNALTIGNDENLKILIRNQTFWLCQKRWMRPTSSIINVYFEHYVILSLIMIIYLFDQFKYKEINWGGSQRNWIGLCTVCLLKLTMLHNSHSHIPLSYCCQYISVSAFSLLMVNQDELQI